MSRALRVLLLVGVATLAGAFPAAAQVAYAVTIESPGSVARGTVVIQARLDGGVGDAKYGAYHVRNGGSWAEGASVKLDKVGTRLFESRSNPWASTTLPNGTYQLEVRVWGDVPSYDASDDATYANQVVSVDVSNPPPAPTGLTASRGLREVQIGWKAVPTAGRSDFAGYRVLRRAGASCSGLSGFQAVGKTTGTSFRQKAPAGRYCFRVVALRTSPVSGTVASAPSSPVQVEVVAAGASSSSSNRGTAAAASLFRGGAGGAAPPRPPALTGGTLIVSDGTYEERLPYRKQTVIEEVAAEVPEFGVVQQPTSTGSQRQTATAVAGGMILAVGALLVRRFLSLAGQT